MSKRRPRKSSPRFRSGPTAQAPGKFTAESLERRILFQITPAQAVDFVRHAWNDTNVSDSVILTSLNDSFNGVSYENWIDFFVNTPNFLAPLAAGNYSVGASRAFDYAQQIGITPFTSQTSLPGVLAAAEMADWPVTAGISSVQSALLSPAYNNQLQLYVAARQAGNTAAQIQSLAPGSFLSAPSVAGGLIGVTSDGWLYTTTVQEGPAGFTPAQLFQDAELVYQAQLAYPIELSADSDTLRQQFLADAQPGAPVITTQPLSQSIDPADTAMFTVIASGDGLQYQWLQNGVDLSGENGSSLSTGTPGVYTVDVSNSSGDILSDPAVLTLDAGGAAVVVQPVSQTVLPGSAAVFSVTASGAAPFTYQWQLNNNDISGANSSTYTTPAAQLANDGDQYQVVVTNAGGVATSLPATLNVSAAPTLTWTGAVSGDWFNYQNWDLGFVPTDVDNVVINSGGLNIPAAAQFASLTISGGFVSGTINVNTLLTWTAGDMIGTDVTVAPGGLFNIAIPNDSFQAWNGNLDNSGTVDWMSGGVAGSGLTITNELAGVFQTESPDTLGGAIFNNIGQFVESAGAPGAELANVTFDNSGGLQVLGGTLSIDTGSSITDDGSIAVAAGAQLVLSGSSNFDAGAIATGPGPVVLEGTVNGTLDGPNFQIPQGLGQSTFTLGGVMTWTGGQLSSVNAVVSSGSELDIDLPTFGALGWTGELDNSGTVDWLQGNVNGNGLTVNNQPSAFFNAESNATLSGATIINDGSLVQLSGASELVSVNFQNNSDGTISVDAGSLSIDTGSTITEDGSNSVASGAQLILSGDSTINPDATFTGPGAVVLEGSVDGTLSGSVFQIPQGLNQSTFTLAGAITWTGGDLLDVEITVPSASVFTIDLASSTIANWNGELDNSGTVDWLSGNINGNGLTINNKSDGVFNAQSNSILSGASINNDGTLNQISGVNELASVNFQNNSDGQIDDQAGTLSIDTGSTITDAGVIDVASAAELVLSGGTTFDPGQTFTGPGPVVLEGTIGGTLNGPNFQIPQGLGESTFTLAGTMTWTAGDLLSVDATINAGSVFNIGIAALTTANWTGELDNFGTVNWNSGILNLPDLTITNESTGVFNAAAASLLTGATINNAGEFSQASGSNELSDVNFTNTGNVDVLGGTFSIDTGSTITDNNTINVAAGAMLVLSGDSTFGASESFTGPGPVDLEGSIGGTLNGPNFLVPQGLNASTFDLAGTMAWTGGDLLSVAATVEAGGVFNIEIGNLTIDNWTGELDNFGTVNWNTGGLNAPDLTINNKPGALFVAQSNSIISDATINNAGEFSQPSGSNELSDVIFTNTGNVVVSGRTLLIDAGSTITDNGKMNVAAGAELVLSGDSSFGATELFPGSGPVELEGTVSGTLLGQNFVVPDGLKDSTFALLGQLAWTGGDLLDVAITVTTTSVLNIELGAGGFNAWSGMLTNDATVNWLSGGVAAAGLTIDNATSGQFVAGSPATLSGAMFTNAGELIQPVGSAGSEFSDVTLDNTGQIVVQAGTMLIDTGSAITDDTTINVATGATLVLSGDSTFGVSETFTGPGPVDLEGSVNGTLSGSNFLVPQGLNASTFDLAGTMTWTGGDMLSVNATVDIGGVFNIEIGNLTIDNWTGELDDFGTVNWNTGGLNAPDLTIVNESSGTFLAQSNSIISDATINNAGEFSQASGSNELSDVIFTNTGNIDVLGGTLLIDTGSTITDDNTINVAAGATLVLSGDSTFGSAETFTGPGPVDLEGSVNGTLAGSNFQVSQGLNASTFTLNGTLFWTGGDLLTTDATVSGAGILNLNLYPGTFPNWTGELDNFGLVNWNTGGLHAPGLTLNNKTTGIIEAYSTSTISGPIINNAGQFIEPTGGSELSDVTLTNTGNIEVDAGTLAIDDGSTITDDTTIDVASGAQIVLSGDSTFAAAEQFTGPGAAVLEGTADGTLNGTDFQIPQGLNQSTFTLNGNMTWTGGDMLAVDATINSASVFNIELGQFNFQSWNGQLDNFGTVNWLSGGLNAPDLTIVNEAKAVFNAQANAIISDATINNAGEFSQPGGSNELSDVNFTNTGNVDVLGGTLYIDAGSTITDDNTINVASGSTLVLSGVSTFASGATFTGPGPVVLEGIADGTLNGPDFQVPQGLTLSTFTLNGTMDWTGGDMLAVDATVNAASVLNINIGSLNTANWSGELDNFGTVNWLSGDLNAPGLTINNHNLIELQSSGILAGAAINNFVTLDQPSGTTELSDVTIDNTGTIDVDGGTLSIDTGSTITDDATFDVASGATLVLSGDSTFGVSETFTGPGPVILEGSITGDLNGPDFQVPQGLTLSTFTLNGTMDWTGGDMLTVDATVNAASVLNINIGSLTTANWSGELDNFGTVNWLSGDLTAPDLTINNSGLFELEAGGILSGAAINNFVILDQPSGTTELSDVTLDNTGALDVDAGTLSIDTGSTIIDSGVINVASGAELILSGISTFNPGETFTGPGPVILEGSITGDLNGPDFQVPQGLGLSTFTLDGTMTWSAGDLLSVDITVAAGGVFNIDLGSLATGNWTGELDNSGTVNWKTAALNVPDLTIINESVGVLNASSGSILTGATIDNAGQFTLPVGSSAVDLVDVTFDNTGDLQALGAVLTFGDGNITFADGCIVAGSIDAGTIMVAGAVTYQDVLLNAVQITGASSLAGDLTWTGGSLSGDLTVLPGALFTLQGTTTINGLLTIQAGATVDLTDSTLTINYGPGNPSPLAAIQADLYTGFNNGLWNGNGLISSTAAANPGYGIGYLDGDVDPGTAAGPGQLVLQYTLVGDAFLENTIGFDDLLVIANHYGTTGWDWAGGNFNYDPSGVVGFSDLLYVAQNYGSTATTPLALLGTSSGSSRSAVLSRSWDSAPASSPAVSGYSATTAVSESTYTQRSSEAPALAAPASSTQYAASANSGPQASWIPGADASLLTSSDMDPLAP